MAWIDDEKSISDSAPVELYTFTTNSGVFRRTSLNEDHVHGGNTFTSIPMMRSTIEVNSAGQAQELHVEMPLSDPVVKGHLPVLPSTFTCLLQRKQLVSGEVRTEWEGTVTSIQVKGRDATLLVPSLMDAALATEVPSAYFQTTCNHVLYDARCQIERVDFVIVTAVNSALGMTVTVASTGGNGDQFFRGGEILRHTDLERRLILSQVGNVLTLNGPFPATVSLPYTVDIVPGCDHTMPTCVAKYGNGRRFGGHPYISVNFVAATRLRESIK